MFERYVPSGRPSYGIPGFAELGLGDSWVLGTQRDALGIVFGVDFALCPHHPLFAPALPNEANSFRRGHIRFQGASSATWPRRASTVNYHSIGDADFGNIGSFCLCGNCLPLEGGWGEREVVSPPPAVDYFEKEDAPS